MKFTGKEVSVILPYVREDGAQKCLLALKEVAPEVEIVAEFDPDRIGPARMIKKLVAKTTRPVVCFLADDTIPEKGFLEEALSAMELLPDGWGMVGLNTGEGNPKAPHWVAHKNLLPLLDGEFHHTGYKHCYGSDEFTDRCDEMGRYVKAWGSLVQHNNPVLKNEEFSKEDVLEKVYGKNGNMAEDSRLYYRRKRERLNRFGIALPIVSASVPVEFFISFACMEKPGSYVLLTPDSDQGDWADNIAKTRNGLILKAREMGVSELLMCDTDQTYPTDTIPKLRSHKVDICGASVHSRWFPHAPIFYRGSLSEYQHIPEQEMYSNELVEIDATGTGCLLINMRVFDEIDPPWFEFIMHRDRPVGEDIHFCHRAKESGFKIFADTSVRVGHLARMEINESLHKVCNILKRGNKDG